jgi:hypothetical protein
MNKSTLIFSITLLLFSGCTQMVTAPISIAGSVVGTTIDVTGSAIEVITPSD